MPQSPPSRWSVAESKLALLIEAASRAGRYASNEDAVSDLELLDIFPNALNNSDSFVANDSARLYRWHMSLRTGY